MNEGDLNSMCLAAERDQDTTRQRGRGRGRGIWNS